MATPIASRPTRATLRKSPTGCLQRRPAVPCPIRPFGLLALYRVQPGPPSRAFALPHAQRARLAKRSPPTSQPAPSQLGRHGTHAHNRTRTLHTPPAAHTCALTTLGTAGGSGFLASFLRGLTALTPAPTPTPAPASGLPPAASAAVSKRPPEAQVPPPAKRANFAPAAKPAGASAAIAASLPRRPLAASAAPTGPEDPGAAPFEYEGPRPGLKPVMRGRLAARLATWRRVVTCSLVLGWIQSGLPLRWADGPPAPRAMANHPSALQHPEFVGQAVADLLHTQAVMRWPKRPIVVSPLGVVPKKGSQKYRLIFDGRYVNSHLVIPTFSYETLSQLPEWARPGDVAFTIDLTSGFHHLMMHESAWPYLGFEWRGEYYVFTSGPFGLATMPWAFTMLMRAVFVHFRRLGHRCTGYIDDSMWFHQSKERLAELRHYALTMFNKLGLCVNFEKSGLDIRSLHVYLGMDVDLGAGVFRVPEDKRDKLFALLNALLHAADRSVPVRQLASAKGKIVAMSWAFGLAAKFFTKSMDADITRAASWTAVVFLSDATITELRFWLAQFHVYNGTSPMWPRPGVDLVIHVDAAGRSAASAGGWGAWCRVNGRRLVARGSWATEAHSAMSSSAQELRACLLALQSFNTAANPLRGKAVQVVTDSMNAALALNRGKVYATDSVRIAQEIFLYCSGQAIRLTCVWVPREQNKEADVLSKVVDLTDCMVDPAAFTALHHRWGPFAVDLFASHMSHQLPQYFSKEHVPGTLGVDAFAYDWGSLGMGWAYPPFNLIASVWAHASHCRAVLCLVVPVWPAKAWWRLLAPDADGFFAAVVREAIVLPARKGLLLCIDKRGARVARAKSNWPLLALLVDFRDGRARAHSARVRIPPDM